MKRKFISLILVFMFLIIGSINVEALTAKELDNLYAQGVKAVLKCKEVKTQESINQAREIIDKFKGNLDWAIGELSRQVDGIQHPILVSIVEGISKNQKAPSQGEVNKIRDKINLLPNAQWRKDYASALDKIQQLLINYVNKFVERYLSSGLTSDKEIAIEKLNIIKTAVNNKPVVEWAEKRSKEIEKNIAPSGDSSIITDNGTFIDSVEMLIFEKVNWERKMCGLEPLQHSNIMTKYAKDKAKDMGDKCYFNHRDLDGNFITVQMNKDGITYRTWGENIAYLGGINDNSGLEEKLMSTWMNSSDHRKNILSNEFSGIGIGIYKIGNTVYATQEFYK